MDSRLSAMWCRSPSPRTSLSSTIKAVLSGFSPMTPPKAPNRPLVSVGTFLEAEFPNEATGSPVGPNGQSPPFSVGASSAVNEVHGRSTSQPGAWSYALRTIG